MLYPIYCINMVLNVAPNMCSPIFVIFVWFMMYYQMLSPICVEGAKPISFLSHIHVHHSAMCQCTSHCTVGKRPPRQGPSKFCCGQIYEWLFTWVNILPTSKTPHAKILVLFWRDLRLHKGWWMKKSKEVTCLDLLTSLHSGHNILPH